MTRARLSVIISIAARLGEPALGDRELIERHLNRVIIKPEVIEIHLGGEDGVVTMAIGIEVPYNVLLLADRVID